MAAEPIKPVCLHSSIISGQPSCVARLEDPSLFIIGTYQLVEGDENERQDGDSQSRTGSLELYRLGDTGDTTLLQSLALPKTETRSHGAVLDIAFCPVDQYGDVLAACTSNGCISFLCLEKGSSGDYSLIMLRSAAYFEENVIITSLAWTTVESETLGSRRARLAMSLGDGRVAVLQPFLPKDAASIVGSQETKPQWIQQIHTESAWTARWGVQGPSESSLLLTGGDDNTIHAIDLLSNSTVLATNQADGEEQATKALHDIDILQARPAPTVWHRYDTKTHQAGVTAILRPGIRGVITGSYDGHIRFLNPIIGRVWPTYADLDLEGGVWQIQCLEAYRVAEETTKFLLLVSCMHAGAKIVELVSHDSQHTWRFNLLASFEQHQSMCYASLGMKLFGTSHGYRIISTSFYDKKLCVWDFDWHLEENNIDAS